VKPLKLDVTHLGRTPLGKDVLAALEAYETSEAERRGWKRYVAVRTRKALLLHGVLGFLKRILARPYTTPGFDALVEDGQVKHVYEWIALKHRVKFTTEEQAVAWDRLRDAGVKRLPRAA